MKRTQWAFAVLLLVIPYFALAPVRASDATGLIRVGLTAYDGVGSLTVIADAACSVFRANTDDAIASNVTAPIEIERVNGALRVKVGKESVDGGVCVIIAPGTPDAALTLSSANRPVRKYRGNIEISLAGGKMRLVNVIAVEDYLLGVLPAEMPESYPVEALKAQAVAARTYALANHRKHADQGFNVCDSGHCQTYVGVLAEKPKCTQAVLDTKAQVLEFRGKPASVMYSADCGGATHNYAELYPNCDAPYLCGTVEPEDIPHMCWEQVYTLKDVETKLVRAGVKDAAGLKSISVGKSGSTGRVLTINVTGATREATITGGKLREALGNGAIKSTLFVIEARPDGSVAFKGKGHGHGCGLCQVGAKGLALPPHGYTCDRILAHYFPGTELTLPPAPVVLAGSGVVTPPMEAKVPSEPMRDPGLPKKEPKRQGVFEVRLKTPEQL